MIVVILIFMPVAMLAITPYLVKFIARGKRIGSISQMLFPHISFCKCCGTSWEIVEEHLVRYRKIQGGIMGCFSICEKCWRELSIEERLPFYRQHILECNYKSETERESDWELLKSAILEGK